MPGTQQGPGMPGNAQIPSIGERLAVSRREIHDMAGTMHHCIGDVIGVNTEFLNRILKLHRAVARVSKQNVAQGVVNHVQHDLQLNVVEIVQNRVELQQHLAHYVH